MADIDLGFVKGNVIKTGTTAPSSALDGDLFYNTSTYHIYQWDASLSTPTWVDKGSIRGPKGDTGDKGDSGAAKVISASHTEPFIFLANLPSEDASLNLTGKVILDVTSVTSSDSNFTATITDVTESFINGERTTVINFKFAAVVTPAVATNFTFTINYKYLETA